MNLSEDVRFALDEKAAALKKRVYDLCVESKCRAYTETHSLPGSERSTAVLQAWDDYQEQQLEPLVREAGPSFAKLAKHFPGSYKQHKALVRDYVINWAIEPAAERSRFWFQWACNGRVGRKDAEWPLWFDAGRPRVRSGLKAMTKTDFITDQESTLRLRLGHVLEWTLKEIAQDLLPEHHQDVTAKPDELNGAAQTATPVPAGMVAQSPAISAHAAKITAPLSTDAASLLSDFASTVPAGMVAQSPDWKRRLETKATQRLEETMEIADLSEPTVRRMVEEGIFRRAGGDQDGKRALRITSESIMEWLKANKK
jgi:hypothetical protein